MKVIQVCPSYYPYIGGVQYHVKLLSEHLAKKNVEVEVYTTDPQRRYRQKEVINHVKVTRLFSFAPENSYDFAPSLLSLLRKARADIIHAHSIHSLPILFAALTKNTNKIPLVSTFYFHGRAHSPFRNFLFQPYKKLLGEYILKQTDLLVCVSEYERKMIKKGFKTCVRTTVIGAGLRFKTPASFPLKNKERKKITYVGRLEEYKGVQYILYAFSRLVKEIDVQLCIIGEGCFESQLRTIARKLEISKNVIFSNKKGDEIIPEYCTSDVVVVPSRQESFNLVAIEALACGARVITTPLGEGYTLVRDGKCIELSNPADVNELYEKIRTTLKHDSKSDSVRQEIINTYSYERIAELTLNAYKNLL
jgi:glycosyltransferase involved in cell wall biosynthesis